MKANLSQAKILEIGGKTFIHPKMWPPIASHEITEPQMSKLMSDQLSHIFFFGQSPRFWGIINQWIFSEKY